MRRVDSVPEHCPPLSEISRRMEAKRRNEDWLREHIPLLRKRCADRYVAVSEGEVRASGKSLEALFRKLRKKYEQDSSRHSQSS